MHFSFDIVLLTGTFSLFGVSIAIISWFNREKREKRSKVYDAIMFIIMISPMTVAIGITYSRIFEFLQCSYIYVQFMGMDFTFGEQNLMLSVQRFF